ncbi:unnamed protein product [Taenia asiatica]|uniref:SH2 domain-containing protein n=1 Tax=Taenia asiatica TaxID=60517 RepID=A0A158R8Z5_TAEAS|nr:unnamed protein product [Taenia asiatica]
MFTSSTLINVDLEVTMEAFYSHSTAQSNAVGGPLRDLTDGAAPKASKSDFASNVSRFFESRKTKVTKNPPPPPARITKATTQNSAALEKVGQKLVSSKVSGPFYDDAWDIRLARFGLQTSASTQQQQHRQEGGRGPPDGAATCESTCSLTSAPSSAKVVALNSATVSNSDVDKVVTTSTTPANTTISTFTSSAPHSATQLNTNSKAASTGKGDSVLLPAETDPVDGVSTPTPLNNSNWFPPPPPTPLHLSLHADEPVASQSGRYHEHRRSFEMDDDQKETKVDPGDAITLPPLSPTSPQENTSVNGGGRTSVASFLLNLPPPPPVIDLSVDQPPSPPAIPPRDPKTSITTPADPPVTDLDGQPPVPEAISIAKPKEDSEKAKVQHSQQKSGVDGRSVVPWERVAPSTAKAIDFSGNLPQWVPPQHSEAAALHYRASRSIGHRSSKSQSGCEDFTDEGPSSGQLSLAAGGRSQSQHRGRRRTTRSFGDDFMDAAETPTNGSSGSRRAVRMNSDSSGMAKARTLVATGDVWAAAVACDGG